jgi:hypothetical protein
MFLDYEKEYIKVNLTSTISVQKSLLTNSSKLYTKKIFISNCNLPLENPRYIFLFILKGSWAHQLQRLSLLQREKVAKKQKPSI